MSMTVDHLQEGSLQIREIWLAPFASGQTGLGILAADQMAIGSLTDDEPEHSFRVARQQGLGSFVPAVFEEPTGFLAEFLAHDWGVIEPWEEWVEDEILTMPATYAFAVQFDIQSISFGVPSPFAVEE